MAMWNSFESWRSVNLPQESLLPHKTSHSHPFEPIDASGHKILTRQSDGPGVVGVSPHFDDRVRWLVTTLRRVGKRDAVRPGGILGAVVRDREPDHRESDHPGIEQGSADPCYPGVSAASRVCQKDGQCAGKKDGRHDAVAGGYVPSVP